MPKRGRVDRGRSIRGCANPSPWSASGRLAHMTGAPTARAPGGLPSAIVWNPARVADMDLRRAVIQDALARAGWPQPTWYETTVEDPGHGQTRDAVANGARVVFACGGDGTVMACVGALTGTETALAVLPAGTGNLLAANLGLPDDPAAGVALATEMGRRRLDVGVVEGQHFAVMAGMGFDADLLQATPARLKARIGVAAYVWSGLQRLHDRPMRVAIRLDDDPPLFRRARTVIVGNVGRLQGGIRLLASAQPDDGQLDVAILAPRSVAHWVRLAWGVLRRQDRIPRMEVLRARRVRISSDRPQPRELDGDIIAAARHMEVTVRPGALLLCVPQPDRTPDMAHGAPDEGVTTPSL